MSEMSLTNLSNGASFYRADLHIHSYGASHDVKDAGATPEAIIRAASDQGLAIIALTDHNEIRNVRAALSAGDAAGICVVPGVELSTPEGHLLCYLPTIEALERFFGRVMIEGRGTPECRCQTGMFQCLNLIGEAGGFAVIAHVEVKGAFEENLPRMTPSKRDILSHGALEGFEVVRSDCPIRYSREDESEERREVAAERARKLSRGSSQVLARVMNSDAHTLTAVGRNAARDQRITRYKMEAPSFNGLLLALRTADTRVRMEDDVPAFVPRVESVSFKGGFLDAQSIRFSANLTCIIGGRGSGKSTAFESICLVGGPPSPDALVVDSDVWPDTLSLAYRDETGQVHTLGRSRAGDVENLDDPFMGETVFPIDSYRQGATNVISKEIQEDPLALLTFLDRLIQVEPAIAEEDTIRTALADLAPKIEDARSRVGKIPAAEKDLLFKSGQIKRLKDDKAEEVIELQRKLEGEKRARAAIEVELGKLTNAVSDEAIVEITESITASIADTPIVLAAPEATNIKNETASYAKAVNGSTTQLRSLTTAFAAKIRLQVDAWKRKEGETTAQIEAKKQELLKVGIRLDMPFITQLVADETRAKTTLNNLKTWKPVLDRLIAQQAELLQKRWAARKAVADLRLGFAARANAALKGTLSDLFVSLKYVPNALAPAAEKLIAEAMAWRTLQHLKAKALVRQLTLPKLLECIIFDNSGPIVALKDEDGAAVFGKAEAETLLERLSAFALMTQLETVAVHDLPRLTVTKRIDGDGDKPQYKPRDFKRLSLGQQQSVLLALMLTSDSRAPLVIDQPEDNLDSEFIYKTLVPVIRAAKERRQVIVVTHNANIAVLGDAELVVALKATAEKASIVERGSLDHQPTCAIACTILEGSREAFERRAHVYGLG